MTIFDRPVSLNRRAFAGALGAACLAPGLARAQGAVPARTTLIELFTSQGCSSCPAADLLMLKLASEPGMLPLTFATEIWDYLGWKDTLAKPAFTRRHKAYAAGIANKRVYTPQAIVNGRAHCVGSDLSALTRLQRNTGNASELASIALAKAEGGWKANLARASSMPARLILMPVSQRQSVEIRRGENMGKTITYANVVRDLIDLGPAPAGEAAITVPPAMLNRVEADAFALVVQAGTLEAPGEVLGAAFSGSARS
jgi:hypothetical protein